MKKYLAVFIVVVTVMSLSSCTGMFPKKTEPSPTESASITSSPSPPVNTSAESAAAAFLAGEPTAPELGKYLKQNAPDLTPEDGDLLLERLLLAQLDISADMNARILDDAYMTALNDTLGGVFDVTKIPNITDKTVQSDFQRVSDSLMTMVRYEETPVFEPNWALIESMRDTFSTQAGVMIEYQTRLQGRYYFAELYNFDLLAADIVSVEAALKNTDSGYVLWQLKNVYTVQVGRLLYGPEGSYLNMFMSGDKQIIANLQKYAGMYTGSSFGAVCKELLAKRSEGEQAVSNYIADRLIFPPNDSRGMSKVNTNYNGAAIQVPQITGMKDTAVMDKVNAAILDAAKALVKSGNDNQTVSSFISFVNDKVININYSYSYRNESDSDNYSESYLMLDLNTGKTVSLDDLIGKPFGAYKDQLLKSMRGTNTPENLKEPVYFMLDSNQMIITVPVSNSDYPDFFTITWNGLRRFMDISKLY